MTEVSRSPDQTKIVALEYQGEVRFGPAYFLGSSTGFFWPLDERLIGEDVHWSEDSRFAVVLVFNSIDASRAPDVELVAIDTDESRAPSIHRNTTGLIHQLGFVSVREYEYEVVDQGSRLLQRWMFSAP